MSNTTIKRATLEHLDPLVELFDAYRVWYRKESNKEAGKAFLKKRIEQNESVIFLAFYLDEAVGFTQLYPLFSSTRMKRIWLLNDLFVSENARGKGISKLLLNAAKDHTRQTGACALTLETEKSNDIGNALYPNQDFILKESHNFYEWERNW